MYSLKYMYLQKVVFVNPMRAGKLQISSAWTNIEKYSTILNLTLSARVCFIHFIHFYTFFLKWQKFLHVKTSKFKIFKQHHCLIKQFSLQNFPPLYWAIEVNSRIHVPLILYSQHSEHFQTWHGQGLWLLSPLWSGSGCLTTQWAHAWWPLPF